MPSDTPVFDQRRKLPHARKRMKLLRYALLFVHNFYFTAYNYKCLRCKCKQIFKTYTLILASFRAIYGEKRMKKRTQKIFFQR